MRKFRSIQGSRSNSKSYSEENVTFKNYIKNNNYKLFYEFEFSDIQDDEIAQQIEQCLFNLEQKRNLGIEPSLTIEYNKQGSPVLILRLFIPLNNGEKSKFTPITRERIKDEIWKVRLGWMYQNIPSSKENSNWLLGLPTVPEIYPRKPVPIHIPVPYAIKKNKNGCTELCFNDSDRKEEIVHCQQQNRYIISSTERQPVEITPKKDKLAVPIIVKKKERKTFDLEDSMHFLISSSVDFTNFYKKKANCQSEFDLILKKTSSKFKPERNFITANIFD